jgi:hypothetical protein
MTSPAALNSDAPQGIKPNPATGQHIIVQWAQQCEGCGEIVVKVLRHLAMVMHTCELVAFFMNPGTNPLLVSLPSAAVV